uniref:Interferon alpha/beta receptor 2 n=1 Tax=Leptobrachium leishanense TaxID=445787 RepID=A0A8C5MHI6_9ANUR
NPVSESLPAWCFIPFSASSDLPPPRNVHLISENFRHVLTWENDNQGASVRYMHYSETRQWQPVPKCSNVTSQQCDLTEYFTELKGYYFGSVQSVGYNKTSEFSNAPIFHPIENTLLGPPIVHVTACNKCVNVSISPPISHIPSGDKNRTISMLDDNVYPIIEYTITVTTEKEKSVPQSRSMIYDNKDELCSPASIVRMENTEPKLDKESRDEKSGLGYAQRKKFLDSDQSTLSGVNNNALLYSTTSSSSGQGSGSSADTGTSRETAMLVDIGGSCSSDTEVPIGFEINPNLSLNTSGTFNINLNSVSVGDPENLWTGLRKEPPSEEVAEAMDNSQGPVLVVLASQGLPPFPNKVEASGLPECDDYNSEEELDSDCSQTSDSDEPFVSNYMRR